MNTNKFALIKFVNVTKALPETYNKIYIYIYIIFVTISFSRNFAN